MTSHQVLDYPIVTAKTPTNTPCAPFSHLIQSFLPYIDILWKGIAQPSHSRWRGRNKKTRRWRNSTGTQPKIARTTIKTWWPSVDSSKGTIPVDEFVHSQPKTYQHLKTLKCSSMHHKDILNLERFGRGPFTIHGLDSRAGMGTWLVTTRL